MTIISLPSLPRSKMYDASGNMSKEWQDFFRDLYNRVGGYSTSPLDDVVSSILASLYTSSLGEVKGRIANLEKMAFSPSPTGNKEEKLRQLLLDNPGVTGSAVSELIWLLTHTHTSGVGKVANDINHLLNPSPSAPSKDELPVADLISPSVHHRDDTLETIIPSSITLTAGTTASSLSDLQTFADGNFFLITEAAATPGLDFIVDFINIAHFYIVYLMTCYDGSSTHAVGVQLYNWVTTTWDTFDKMISSIYDITTAGGYIVGNHSFTVPDCYNYIGTGVNLGKVRLRLYHTMAGNASHHTVVDSALLLRKRRV